MLLLALLGLDVSSLDVCLMVYGNLPPYMPEIRKLANGPDRIVIIDCAIHPTAAHFGSFY